MIQFDWADPQDGPYVFSQMTWKAVQLIETHGGMDAMIDAHLEGAKALLRKQIIERRPELK